MEIERCEEDMKTHGDARAGKSGNPMKRVEIIGTIVCFLRKSQGTTTFLLRACKTLQQGPRQSRQAHTGGRTRRRWDATSTTRQKGQFVEPIGYLQTTKYNA